MKSSDMRASDDSLFFANQIDVICDDFELCWKRGEQPAIADYLRSTDSLVKSTLLVELVRLEFSIREQSGDRPLLDEYFSQFPEYSDNIKVALSEYQQIDRNAGFGTRAGSHYGHFCLLSQLGQGGFGAVWRAYDTNLNRYVAVKVPRPERIGLDKLNLFLREAQAAARLVHPNIVRVYEVGQQDRLAFIVSELVEGGTLEEWLSQNCPSNQQSAEICCKLARAIHYAHDQGIVHRDVKPSNVLIDSLNEPRLTDFGLAKHLTDQMFSSLVDEGQLIGTPAYMSPEQASAGGDIVDQRTDVYSLGILLYRLLTGSVPFAGEPAVVIYQVQTLEPVPPSKLTKSIAPDLETICLKAIEKPLNRRYQNADEFANDLERFLQGKPVLARPTGFVERGWRLCRRNAVISLTVVFAALTIIAVFSIITFMPSGLDSPEITRSVFLTTTPAGAEVVFVPLDPITGEPLPDRLLHAPDKTPIQLDLTPGNYLVVTYLNDEEFHEVYRLVPGSHAGLPGAYKHRSWSLREDGVVELPAITIPPPTIINGMAYINGKEVFEIGSQHDPSLPAHRRSVHSYYLDPTEVTVEQWQIDTFDPNNRYDLPRQHRHNPLPENYAVSYIDYDWAVSRAEAMGKRLPDEVEYEYAATAMANHRFPWGDTDEYIHKEDLTIGPVRDPNFDQLGTDPPVFGLCSNVAEWTSSGYTLYPKLQKMGMNLNSEAIKMRIVRGGTAETIDALNVTIPKNLPAVRIPMKRLSRKPGLGFRCARSAKPRREAKQFSTTKPQ